MMDEEVGFLPTWEETQGAIVVFLFFVFVFDLIEKKSSVMPF